MTSDGTPWRPLVHVLDIGKAIACVLDAPRDVVHAEVFNVGDSAQNYRVRDIAEIVGKVFEGCELSFGDVGADNRSYRVSFDKIHERLPAFSCDWNAERGAQQLYDVFRRIDMDADVFGYPRVHPVGAAAVPAAHAADRRPVLLDRKPRAELGLAAG